MVVLVDISLLCVSVSLIVISVFGRKDRLVLA
jgi:hypothetical protein